MGQACVAELGLCMVRRMWRAGQWGKVMREVRVGKYDMPLLYSVLFIGGCYLPYCGKLCLRRHCDVVSHFGAGFGAHMTWRCLSQKVPLESLLNSPQLWSICGDR